MLASTQMFHLFPASDLDEQERHTTVRAHTLSELEVGYERSPQNGISECGPVWNLT